jgi:hypothetical protein
MDVSTSAKASAVCLALSVLALAGCGSGRPSSTPTAGSLYQQLVAGYVAFAGCARSHGLPGLPDPQVDDQGNDHYPGFDRAAGWRWPQSVLVGCARVWDRVHAIRDRFDSAHPQPAASPAEHARSIALARCIRAHGFPTFPDPAAGGGFAVGSVPAGFVKPNLSARARAALTACGSSR